MLIMIRVRQLKVEVKKDSFDVLQKKVLTKLKISFNDLKDMIIIKKSIDARDKNNILYIYEVNVEVSDEDKILKKIKSKDIEKVKEVKYSVLKSGKEELNNRPVVVGAGPCGLFCTLILAENGYNPILIERGERVEDRISAVEYFWEKGILNKESNVCFGEGGAGTFSDGKLNTLVNDKEGRIKKVYDTFISCGAPCEISYVNKPHIGSNKLKDVIKNLRNKIISLGGEIMYRSCLTNIEVVDNKLESITINKRKKVKCDCLVLAIGHSARDTIKMLYDKGLKMNSKPFAIGVRVQHKQDMINISQYGSFSEVLPPASYKLTYQASNNRGVYTFCMCPGGYVVNSSCEEGHLMINGMSNHERDTENANSAVVVTVDKNDFGPNPMDGIEFQRKLEAVAYRKGNGKIPVQLLSDYKNNKVSNHFESINPVFKGNYSFTNLNEIFPYYINDSIKEAMEDFGKKIKGFNSPDTILAGVESRTSSAIRIERGENFVSNILGIYPSGEGAGYSGGITTSAIDGIKTAEKIIEKYSKISK